MGVGDSSNARSDPSQQSHVECRGQNTSGNINGYLLMSIIHLQPYNRLNQIEF